MKRSGEPIARNVKRIEKDEPEKDRDVDDIQDTDDSQDMDDKFETETMMQFLNRKYGNDFVKETQDINQTLILTDDGLVPSNQSLFEKQPLCLLSPVPKEEITHHVCPRIVTLSSNPGDMIKEMRYLLQSQTQKSYVQINQELDDFVCQILRPYVFNYDDLFNGTYLYAIPKDILRNFIYPLINIYLVIYDCKLLCPLCLKYKKHEFALNKCSPNGWLCLVTCAYCHNSFICTKCDKTKPWQRKCLYVLSGEQFYRKKYNSHHIIEKSITGSYSVIIDGKQEYIECNEVTLSI